MNDAGQDVVAEVLGVHRSATTPLMASEIAQQLRAAGHANIDKRQVNHLLYGPLKGQVRQDVENRGGNL